MTIDVVEARHSLRISGVCAVVYHAAAIYDVMWKIGNIQRVLGMKNFSISWWSGCSSRIQCWYSCEKFTILIRTWKRCLVGSHKVQLLVSPIRKLVSFSKSVAGFLLFLVPTRHIDFSIFTSVSVLQNKMKTFPNTDFYIRLFRVN